MEEGVNVRNRIFQPITFAKKEQYINSFRQIGYQDFLTNRLTQPNLRQLNSKIDQLIATDDSKRVYLSELRTFLNRNNVLFPELSHGTSSDAVVSIIKHGLHPRSRVLQFQDAETQHIGEGARGNFARIFTNAVSQEVYMGIGQGGLGTTIAYAEMIDYPSWNFNLLSREEIIELQKKYQEILTNVGDRDREAKQILEDHLTALGSGLIRHQKGIAADFPVIIGMARGDDGESPTDPSFRFLYDIRRGTKYLKREGGFDSEVAVTMSATENTNLVQIIATPSKSKGTIETMLQETGRDNIEVISIEALKLLGEVGYPRVIEAYQQGKDHLYGILNRNDRYVKRAVNEFERGVPPFDYSALEEV